MYLVYLGESGNTGTSLKDPNQPHHVYVGLMVHESQWDEVKEEFSQICHRYFGRSLGEPGTPREINAAEVLHGKGPFSSWPMAKRLQLVDDLLGILIRRNTPLIVSYVDKQEFASAKETDSDRRHWWQGLWEPAFSRFVFTLGLYMDDLNMREMSPEELHRGDPLKVTERATIIADGDKSVEPQFMQEFIKTEIDLPTEAVLQNVHFVRSQDSHCIQLADICAYFTRRHLHQPSQPNPQYTALEKGHVIEVVYQVQM